MSTQRLELLNRVIASYGFENKVTIDFARLCELLPQTEENEFKITNRAKALL